MSRLLADADEACCFVKGEERAKRRSFNRWQMRLPICKLRGFQMDRNLYERSLFDIPSRRATSACAPSVIFQRQAHGEELNKEQTGRKNIEPPVSIDARRNHVRIGSCIDDASLALSGETHLPWALSRDWNYQMSNRFAWSWKLTELGFPVVLIYLGFLKAEEMRDKGKPFANHLEWERLVKAHS